MNFEQSYKWQCDSVEAYIDGLKESLGDSVNDGIIDVMRQLYIAGWDSCYRHARINGVLKYD